MPEVLVAIVDKLVLPVVCSAEVAMPVVFVAIVARVVFPALCKALVELPVVFVAIVAREVFPVVCNAEVLAPVGRPRTVLGETLTTRAGSVVAGAVEAALTAAVFVPSFIFVV
jgi:hypothetical protein